MDSLGHILISMLWMTSRHPDHVLLATSVASRPFLCPDRFQLLLNGAALGFRADDYSVIPVEGIQLGFQLHFTLTEPVVLGTAQFAAFVSFVCAVCVFAVAVWPW